MSKTTVRRTSKIASKPAKPLTLADIAITWTRGSDKWAQRHYVTGQTLARAVEYLYHRSPSSVGHDPLGEEQLVPSYLRGFSYLVFPDAGNPSEDLDKDVRFTASELLEHFAALLNSADARPADFQVHVGPIPEEWKK